MTFLLSLIKSILIGLLFSAMGFILGGILLHIFAWIADMVFTMFNYPELAAAITNRLTESWMTNSAVLTIACFWWIIGFAVGMRREIGE